MTTVKLMETTECQETSGVNFYFYKVCKGGENIEM